LREAAGALAVPADRQAERDRLLAEIENGLALLGELERTPAPTSPTPPFDDLRAHFAGVDAAAARHPTGPELAAWRARAVRAARADDELGKSALLALTSAWARWQGDRARAGGDAARLGDLASQLDGIEQAKAVLLALVPGSTEAVQAALPAEALAAARRGLAASPGGPGPDVDVAELLAECRAELLRTGPTKELRERVDRLQPTRREQIAAQGQLQNEIDAARLASEQALGLQTTSLPDPPQPPFDDVARYWQALERALQPVQGADGALPPWAARLRADLRAEAALQPRVIAACVRAFERWQQRPAGGDAAAELAQVRAARARALELFPGAAADLDQALPAAALASAAAALEREQARAQWLTEAAETGRQFAQVATLAEWAAAAERHEARVESLRQRAGAWPGDGEVDGALQRLVGAAGRWSAALGKLQAVDKHLGAGELSAADGIARAAAGGVEGRAELLAVGEVVAGCADAFEVLDRSLAVADALNRLRGALEKARGTGQLPLAVQRLRNWIQGLERLQAASSGMVPIPGGRPKGGLAPVGSFFLAATECSAEEFAQFLDELRAATAGRADAAQRLAAVEVRLPDLGLSPERLQELLDFRVRPGRLPVENVTWYGAAAFAAWRGRALPTAAEWALAAFGDGGKYEFSWGNGWSNDRQQRNPSDQTLAEVGDGGLSWRQADGLRIHHLSGNVAEWLAAEPGARTAFLAGGRYSDRSDSSVREQAAGRLLEAEKADGRKGFGFRTVLRPRQFPGLEWPK
jgi:formylglycine-generating enzyme required for sulfatase activity